MKLISCHIENFGKLHDYSVDFSDGANIFREENGWGKSTFAAFVRAMFYGLEGDRKRAIEENERKRYKPWQGGVFGGQLVFEMQGKEYQISRIFNDKDVNDEFELRDARTNLPSKDYTVKIGEEIFKINRESFMRTVFIGQGECETAATDDINAKIGNLADNSNDLNNYDAAYTKLTEIMNALTPSRATGSLAKRRDEIAGYERIVQSGQGISDSMDTYQEYLRAEEESYEALKVQLQEAGKEQTRIAKLQAVLVEKTEWERLKKDASEKKKEVETISERLPGDVPALDEIKKELIVCGDMDKAFEKVSLYRMTESETSELSSLSMTFADGIPEVSDIDSKIRETAMLREIGQELSSEQMTSAEKSRLEELEQYFTDDSESIAAVVSKWNNRNNKKAALPSNQAALAALRASLAAQQQQTKKISPLIIIGIIAVLSGAVAAFTFSPSVGLAVAAAGVVLLVVGFLVNKKGAAQPEISPEMENLQRTIEEDIDLIVQVDAEVADYLKMHGKVFEEYTVSAVLQEITAEFVEYGSLKKKSQRSADSTKAAEYDTLKQGIFSFLNTYGAASSENRFADDLYALKSKVSGFLTLCAKRDHLETADKEYKAYHDELVQFLEKYGYEPKQDIYAQLNDIRDVTDDYCAAVKAQNNAAAELQQFENDHDVTALSAAEVDENLPSPEIINERILRLTAEMERVQNTILSYNKTLEDLQETYDEWEESRTKLEELKELQAAEQRKYNYVQTAKVKLALAKEAMTAKYADPILQSFSKYYEMISEETADAFHVDANTAVTVDELGKQRGVNTLSSGYKDLVGICLRIALVDAMYRAETPVLIMDDPFTNLDDAKIQAGKKFLEAVAEKYQIIYFTCSRAR